MSLGRILAAVSDQRRRWHAEIVRSGRDLNGRKRSPASLRAAVESFEGRPLKIFDLVTADGRRINDHQQIEDLIGLEASNVVGFLRGVRYDERAFGGVGGLVGEAVILDGDARADEIEGKLESLAKNGGLGSALGLSFNGYGRVDKDGNEWIESVDSVDFVTHPAAYGRVSHRLAASHRSVPMRDLLTRLTAACAALAAGLPDNVSTDFALGKHLAARIKASADLAKAAATGLGLDAAALAADPLDPIMGWIEKTRGEIAESARVKASEDEAARLRASKDDDEVKAQRLRAKNAADEVEILATESRVRAACQSKGLPEKVTTRILASTKGKILSVDAATALAADKAAELDDLRVADVGNRIVVVAEKRDRLVASLARMISNKVKWDPKDGIDPTRVFMGSIHKFARDGFGIDFMEAARGDAARRVLRASIDGTGFDAVFAEALNRSMLAEYQGDGVEEDWRDLCNVVPERDFREKSIIATTYYDELPVVLEGAAYLPMTTPTDRVEKMTMEKRGGTEDITWEKMLNDDLGIFSRCLRGLARTAKETLVEAVYKCFRIATQKTMADGYALTHASHVSANLSTTYDLSGGGSTAWGYFLDAVTMMTQQTGGGGVAKGIKPAHIIIPVALAKVVGQLFSEFSAAAADVPTRRGLEILGAVLPKPHVDFRTSNAKDWFLVADPQKAEVLRLAFLGGKEEPDVFIANNETFGSMFTNDKIVVKVRHPFKVGTVDYAGVQGNDIA